MFRNGVCVCSKKLHCCYKLFICIVCSQAWTPPNLPQMMPAATTPMPTAAAVAAAAVTAKINAMDLAVQVPHHSTLHITNILQFS